MLKSNTWVDIKFKPQSIFDDLTLNEHIDISEEFIQETIKSIFSSNKDAKRQGAMIVNWYYAASKESTDIESAIDRFTYYWSAFNSLYKLFKMVRLKDEYNRLFAGLKGNNDFPSEISKEGITIGNTDAKELGYWVTFRKGERISENDRKGKLELLWQYFNDNLSGEDFPESISPTDMLQIIYDTRNTYIHGNAPLPIVQNSTNLKLLDYYCICLHKEVGNYCKFAFKDNSDKQLNQWIKEIAFMLANSYIDNRKPSNKKENSEEDEVKIALKEYVKIKYMENLF